MRVPIGNQATRRPLQNLNQISLNSLEHPSNVRKQTRTENVTTDLKSVPKATITKTGGWSLRTKILAFGTVIGAGAAVVIVLAVYFSLNGGNNSTTTILIITTSGTTVTTTSVTTTTVTTTTTSTTTSTTSTTSTTTTTGPVCTPFWKMPSTDEGTNLTYSSANTLISGDVTRGVCATFRTDPINVNTLIYDFGSNLGTYTGGCNQHSALMIINNSTINLLSMCGQYDNDNFYVGGNTIFDGNYHQICVTYDHTATRLCAYLDLLAAQCLVRSNVAYNTSLGDVRIGWWPDNNFVFSSAGGSIKWVSLFNTPMNQSCVTYQYQLNNHAG